MKVYVYAPGSAPSKHEAVWDVVLSPKRWRTYYRHWDKLVIYETKERQDYASQYLITNFRREVGIKDMRKLFWAIFTATAIFNNEND